MVRNFSLPLPKLVSWPLLQLVLGLRGLYYFVARVFFCEPLFKAYCKQYGRRLKTSVFLHWVQGRGDIIIGDDVLVDGKSSFAFAARYSKNPTLIIGNNTYIGHNCQFTVGKQVKIGSNCLLASEVHVLDSPGHSTDPTARLAGQPAMDDEVRPVTIGDNVWIGMRSTILPGVVIGDNSVVATGSIVTTSVPANTLVAGIPARQIRSLAAKETTSA